MNLSKERIELEELLEKNNIPTKVLIEFFKTHPSIYQSAGLTKATVLTDEQLEKEAERLYPYSNLNLHAFYSKNEILDLERQAHIKARKMGSSGWSDEDMINFHIEVMKQGLANEGEQYNAEDLALIKESAKTFLSKFKPSPPKT